MGRPVCCLIDASAVRNNLVLLKTKSPISKIIAVVKADAYGHGIKNIINALAQADALAVSSIDEAIALRKMTNKIIFLLEGFFNFSELHFVKNNNIKLVLHTREQFLSLLDWSLDISVWVKINTGMNRLGFSYEDVLFLCNQLDQNTKCKINVEGLITHYANADEPKHYLNQKQIENFYEIKQILKKDISISISNSAAILSGIAQNEWVRPGIALYGASPFIDKTAGDLGLIPAMTLVSKLISIRFCYAGDNVGYGAEYICAEDMLIGVVAIGYGDGYPRHATMGTPVLINGVVVPLIGLVCMDMIMVDLRLCNNAQVGDDVTLWGKNLPIEVIAKKANTIPNQLMTGVSSRVIRNIEFY